MNTQDYTSLDLSKKLQQAGFYPHEPSAWWDTVPGGEWKLLSADFRRDEYWDGPSHDAVPAWSCGELGRALISGVCERVTKTIPSESAINVGKLYGVDICPDGKRYLYELFLAGDTHYITHDSEPEARCLMVLWLINNGYMKARTV